MKSSFSHSSMLKPQFHNSIPLPPSSATIQSPQRLSYCLAPFSHPSLCLQKVPSLWPINHNGGDPSTTAPYTNEPSLIQAKEKYRRLEISTKDWRCCAVDVDKIGAIVANSMAIDINPCSERPPRKRMRSPETVDMKTLFHLHRFFK